VVPISASVPVVLEVPIQIAVRDTPLDRTLAQAQTYLERLAAQLGSSLLSGPVPSATPGR
jgi:hypothetical protein